jgi:cell division protein FtsQ
MLESVKRPEGVPAPTAAQTNGARSTKGGPPRSVRAAPAGPRPSAEKAVAPRAGTRASTTASTPASTTAGSRRPPEKTDARAAAKTRKRYERLEVKRFTRRARRRRTGWFVAVLLVAAVGGLVAAAVFSPLLALRTITVDGTSRLDSATIEKAVDGQLGTPLALLNYGEVTRDLAPFSLIRSYATEIVPPGTLVIHVVERTPIGAIQGADSFDLVDPAGVTVDSSKVRPVGYPLIQLGDGRLSGPGFASMAQVLLALPPAVLAKVDTITAQTHDDVTLTLTGSDQRVVWGSSADSDAKAQVLADLIALHAGSGAGEYDVSAPGTAVFHRD